MAEIKKPLIQFVDLEGKEFAVIDPDHSHADILRYVVAEVGAEEAQEILNLIIKEETANG